LEKEMIAGNKLWYAQPSAVTSLLKTTHEMIRLDKVPGGKFTPDGCMMLLAANTASMDCLKRPSYKKHKAVVVEGFLDEVIAVNSSCEKTVKAIQRLKTEEI
jgi:hypothetical protein